MRGGHALRGMVTAWLGLIALQTVGTKGGSGRVAGFFGDVDRLVQRALDPSIPAIPDRRAAAGSYQRPADLPVPAPSPFPTRIGGGGGTAYAN